MLKAEGYRVDQGVGAQAQIPDQFAGLFAVKKDNLHTALGGLAADGCPDVQQCVDGSR